jgi:hypothetical protein
MNISISRVPDKTINFTVDPLTLFPELTWHDCVETGDRKAGYATRCQIGWSEGGLYLVVDCEDKRLTSSQLPDFADLYTEDVVEIFLWPEESKALYFEYEISPFGAELPLLVPNTDGTFMGWLPWHYEGERRVQKQVVVRGGDAVAGGAIEGWSVALHIPFALLKGMGNVPSSAGTVWRGNVCRMDYDQEPCAKWSLSPGVGGEFHRFGEFANFQFEG